MANTLTNAIRVREWANLPRSPVRKKRSRARKGVVNEDGHRLAPAGTEEG